MVTFITSITSKKHLYFLDLTNASYETVSPHSACILPSMAGFWAMTKVPVTMPHGLFPQTLNYRCPFHFPLQRPHQAHRNTVADLHWQGEKNLTKH